MATEVTCSCKEWKNWSEQIFNAQVQHTIRTGEKYTGAMWAYCPWCGKKLAPVGTPAPAEESEKE